MKKVLVGGCFDLIHIGHIRFLKEAKKQGDLLIVALESDEFIRLMKKKEPFHIQKERAEVLQSIKYVDEVISLPLLKTYDDYEEMVMKIKPDSIAVTKNDSQMELKRKHAEKVGAELRIVTDVIADKSSTLIRDRLSNKT